MGKGDKKTKRGKIYAGTFGVRRPKKKKTGAPVDAAKSEKKVAAPKAAKAPAKKAAVKEKK